MAPTQPPGPSCRHRRTEVRWSIAADPAAAAERSQGRCPKQGQPPHPPPSALGRGGRRAAAGRQARHATKARSAVPPHTAGLRTAPMA